LQQDRLATHAAAGLPDVGANVQSAGRPDDAIADDQALTKP
jgi:hypothetical protein